MQKPLAAQGTTRVPRRNRADTTKDSSHTSNNSNLINSSNRIISNHSHTSSNSLTQVVILPHNTQEGTRMPLAAVNIVHRAV